MDIVAAPGPRGVGARRGVALFADVTIVAVHSCRGEARGAAASTDGSVLQMAVNRKRQHHRDVIATPGAAFLVLGCEVYGRWSQDALHIMRELSALKGTEAPESLRQSARHGWASRWWALVSVGTQRAIAEALLRHGGVDLQASPAVQPAPPLAEVLMAA